MASVHSARQGSVQDYNFLIGKRIKFTYKYGQPAIGYVKDIKLNVETSLIHAKIKFIRNGNVKTCHVPVTDIIGAVSANSSTVHPIKPAHETATNLQTNSERNDTFTYGLTTYVKTDYPSPFGFKVGDEVVWKTPVPVQDRERHPNGGVLVGNIRQIGQDNKSGDYAAIVQFDEPTNHFPRYIQIAPKNRNIVSLSELVQLAEFLNEEHPQEEEVDKHFPRNVKEDEGDLINFAMETDPFNLDPSGGIMTQPQPQMPKAMDYLSELSSAFDTPPPVKQQPPQNQNNPFLF